MNMIEAWKTCMTKYVDFNGCASRSEFFLFNLANFIIGFVLGFIAAILGSETLFALINLLSLGTVLPSIAAWIRRMHDSDHSGWWTICPFANIIFLFFPTVPNRWNTEKL
jgi:uncharacterized membrane protein YhaH (DUF805 family)